MALSVTDVLEAAQARRAELYDALAALEGAAALPIQERNAWRAGVRAALDALRMSFVDHVSVTEGPQGLFAEILDTAPRLSGPVSRLTDDHRRLFTQIDDVASSLDNGSSEEELRIEVLRLLGRLARHRQLGSDLVFEAYETDIGNVD